MTTQPAARYRRGDLVLGALLGIVLVIVSFFVLPAGPAPAADCQRRVDLEISSSTEKVALLKDLAARYEQAHRVVDSRCAGNVMVAGMSSGAAKIALANGWQLPGVQLPPRPQVWLPTSSMWLGLLDQEGKGALIADDPPPRSVTASTLVIAMPKSVVDALKKAGAPLDTWRAVLALAQQKTGWAAYGHPDWGKFLLGRDNPEASTSGLAATVATYYAAPGDMTAERLTDPAVIQFVHGIESSVARYGDEAVDFMTKIFKEEQKRDNDADRPYLDALVVQEAMVYQYNCGSPTGDPKKMDCAGNKNKRLAVVHPKDGTLELDHPFVTLSSATPDQRVVARDFFDFLREPEQRRAFRAQGFREPEHAERPTGELVHVLAEPADQRLTFVEPPPADLLAKMLKNWVTVKKKARVLIVLDVSGSMNDVVDDPTKADNDPTKLGLVKPAAKEALDLLDDGDEVGLWTFSSGPPTEVMPLSPVGQVRDELKARIDALTAKGNTALYSAIEQAHDTMAAKSDPDRINAVVVLSDGANTQRYANTDDPTAQADALESKLNPAGRDTTVRIFPIPYGTDHVPEDVLTRVAEVTRATKCDASNPLDIGKAFVCVFENFG